MKRVAPWIGGGLAMFSMFFGAGNVIFPLIVGQFAAGHAMMAMLGLICTAVMIPFSGLIAISLYDGNYFKFFNRMGKWPGYVAVVLILALIGPFGGIPRCISLTYATISHSFGGGSILLFSLLFSGLIAFFALKRNRILDILGYVLTPLLLLFLLFFVCKGVFSGQAPDTAPLSAVSSFFYGLKEGYNTMDLLAAFFFASIVCARFSAKSENSRRGLMISTAIGGSLLALVYIGFGFVASHFRAELAGVHPDQLLGAIGSVVLGPYAGVIISMIVALSCLTTAIALSVITSEFLQEHLLGRKVSYQMALFGVLGVSSLVSTLHFSGIVAILAPVLQVMYPALLILCLINILHKITGFKPVKTPVYLVLLFALVAFLAV